MLALALAHLDQQNRAVDEMTNARELAPDNLTVLVNAVLTFERIGRRDLAVQICRDHGTKDLLSQFPSFPELLELRRDPACQGEPAGNSTR